MEAVERERAIDLLAQSRERLVLTTAGLFVVQLNFHAAEDRWSIADCIEHITVVENNVLGNIQKILQSAPEPARQAEVQGKDQVILEKVPARERRVKGPAEVMPKGRWPNSDELLRQFELARERSVRFCGVTQADLRSHFFPHPILGLLDCYQWLLFLGTHCERHVRQIEEVKAEARFPRQQAGEATA